MINHLIDQIKQDKFINIIADIYPSYINTYSAITDVDYRDEEAFNYRLKSETPEIFIEFQIEYRYYDWLPGYRIFIYLDILTHHLDIKKCVYKGYTKFE